LFQAAVAQAVLAYQLYKKMFSGPRWERLEKRGAKKQRLMWASTNVKNSAYPDTFYADSLIGPDTVSHISQIYTFLHTLSNDYLIVNDIDTNLTINFNNN